MRSITCWNWSSRRFHWPGGPGTFVIPGHGRPLDYSDVEDYRDIVVIVRDVIDDMVGRGMTLEQVKAANRRRRTDGRYGADESPWTTDMFVEAVFKGLTVQKREPTTP